jgi:hypothetical protein
VIEHSAEGIPPPILTTLWATIDNLERWAASLREMLEPARSVRNGWLNPRA